MSDDIGSNSFTHSNPTATSQPSNDLRRLRSSTSNPANEPSEDDQNPVSTPSFPPTQPSNTEDNNTNITPINHPPNDNTNSIQLSELALLLQPPITELLYLRTAELLNRNSNDQPSNPTPRPPSSSVPYPIYPTAQLTNANNNSYNFTSQHLSSLTNQTSNHPNQMAENFGGWLTSPRNRLITDPVMYSIKATIGLIIIFLAVGWIIGLTSLVVILTTFGAHRFPAYCLYTNVIRVTVLLITGFYYFGWITGLVAVVVFAIADQHVSYTIDILVEACIDGCMDGLGLSPIFGYR